MSQEHVDAVRRGFEGWNRDDFDAFVEKAHSEIEWISEVARLVEGSETVYRGVEGLRRYWDEWHSVWDVTIGVREIRDLGDIVLAFAQVQTRGGASGVDLEQPVAFRFEFEDGLARRVRSYLEPEKALETVGLG